MAIIKSLSRDAKCTTYEWNYFKTDQFNKWGKRVVCRFTLLSCMLENLYNKRKKLHKIHYHQKNKFHRRTIWVTYSNSLITCQRFRAGKQGLNSLTWAAISPARAPASSSELRYHWTQEPFTHHKSNCYWPQAPSQCCEGITSCSPLVKWHIICISSSRPGRYPGAELSTKYSLWGWCTSATNDSMNV